MCDLEKNSRFLIRVRVGVYECFRTDNVRKLKTSLHLSLKFSFAVLAASQSSSYTFAAKIILCIRLRAQRLRLLLYHVIYSR